MDGAFGRGHGDFGNIWGVVCHHTGSFGETPNGIAFHPSLGLASQLFLHRDGYYVLCGVGVAWHAGSGSWPGLPMNGANQYTIGIEAQNDGGGSPGKPHHTPWSDAQYNAYIRGVAAILNKLGQPSSHAIGHKDWAGPAQGKWDPGGIDMNIFRSDVGRTQSGIIIPKEENDLQDDERKWLREVRDKLLAYPDVPEIAGKWPSRARCRRGTGGVDDTVGIGLYADANIYDLLTAWSAVEVGDPFSVETINLGAQGKLPANDPDSVRWFKSVQLKIQGAAKV
jgi:hypothetical protein